MGDSYVLSGDLVTDMVTGESWEATPLQKAALTHRDRGYTLWLLTDTQASLSSTFRKGWKTALLTFVLSFLIPVVGTALWFVWYCCLRTENIELIWTYEGELVEKKRSLLGSLYGESAAPGTSAWSTCVG